MHINDLTIDQLKTAYVQSMDSVSALTVLGMKGVACKYSDQAKAIMARISELEPAPAMSDDELLAELA